MPDLKLFIIELLKQQKMNDSILELSNQVKNEPYLREILLLARETEQFNIELKSKNTKIAETKLRECLESSILESKTAYLHSTGRRFFKQLIESKLSELSNNEDHSSNIKDLKNIFGRFKGTRQDTETPSETKIHTKQIQKRNTPNNAKKYKNGERGIRREHYYE